MTLQNPPAALDIPTGGHLAIVGGESVDVPVAGAATPTGVGFGPLEVGVPEDAYAHVERVEFAPGEDSSGGLFALTLAAGTAGGAKAADAPDDARLESPSLSRRAVLGAAVGLATAAVAGRTVAGAEEMVTLRIAELDVPETNAPIQVSVLDLVDEVLPPTTEMLTDVDGARVGQMAEPGEGVTLAADTATAGTIRVYLRDSISRLDQLLSWALSLLPSNTEVTYARTFPGDTKASDYSEGEFVTLTEHPSIVEPLEDSDPKEVRLVIGNTTIPHESEGANGAGAWSVFDSSVIYEAGSDPPASGEYEITIGVGLIDRILNGD